MIINAMPLNNYCRHVHFTMDTVSRVPVVAEEGVFMGSLNDNSGFHNLAWQPESWPLFGVHSDGVDYVCTTLPFGWNESSLCYHSLSKAKAAYLESQPWPISTTPATPTSSRHSGQARGYSGLQQQKHLSSA